MSRIRTALKKIGPLVKTVRFLRTRHRDRRTKALQQSMPDGGFIRSHGLEIFCDFKLPTYVWYDGQFENLKTDQSIIEQLVNQSDGDLFLDIGAHFGYYTALYQKLLGPKNTQSTVIALEPDKSNFRCLERTAERNACPNVQTRLLYSALAKESGTANLYRGDGDDCLHSYSGIQSSQVDTVPALTLDEIVAKHGGGAKTALIKIDVDGAEPVLFAGGKSVLRSQRPIILMEFAPKYLRQFGADPEKFFKELARDYRTYWVDTRNQPRVSPISTQDYERVAAMAGDGITDLVLASSELKLK